MTKMEEYKKVLLESFRARLTDNVVEEDKALDILNDVWYAMSLEEQGIISEFSRMIGGDYLNASGDIVKPLPDRWA